MHMHHSQHFCHILNAFWHTRSERVFSSNCNSALIISNVSKRVVSSIGKTEKSCRNPSQASRVDGEQQSWCFLVTNFLVKIDKGKGL
jgi:hypothetical protein